MQESEMDKFIYVHRNQYGTRKYMHFVVEARFLSFLVCAWIIQWKFLVFLGVKTKLKILIS